MDFGPIPEPSIPQRRYVFTAQQGQRLALTARAVPQRTEAMLWRWAAALIILALIGLGLGLRRPFGRLSPPRPSIVSYTLIALGLLVGLAGALTLGLLLVLVGGVMRWRIFWLTRGEQRDDPAENEEVELGPNLMEERGENQSPSGGDQG
jgi:hypothetical protein